MNHNIITIENENKSKKIHNSGGTIIYLSYKND